jgi:iron(III) transport system permease protein
VIGFLLPAALLLRLAILYGHDPLSERYLDLTANTFTLAAVAAVAATLLATVLVYAARLDRSGIGRGATQIASLGYAVPGSVIAVAILLPLAGFDNAVDLWMEETFGFGTGLLLTGSIAALIYAYLVRFLAVSVNAVDSATAKVTPNMDAAARSLGASAAASLRRVHVPLIKGGVLTSALIVFVDVTKELPATLIMRPFDFDTLAIQAYRLASDERLAEASTAALMIVAVGLAPVIVLSRAIMGSRPGRAAGTRTDRAVPAAAGELPDPAVRPAE